jgi:hypothetical protein
VIVLFEHSPSEFKEFPKKYIHKFTEKSDTGLKLDLLQKYIFVPLDIFRKNVQNRGIRNKMDAWLTFLCMDSPEMIIKLLRKYPEFKPMYEHVYDMCRNVERMMEMFSKELLELDRNTVQYMIDEMQEDIDRQAAQLNNQAAQLKDKDTQLKDKDTQLKNQNAQIQELLKKIQELQANQ